MLPTVFGGIVALVGIWCQFGAYPRTLVAMFGLVVFGAASALDLPALGGASVTPANFFLMFFLLRLVSMRGGTGALIAEIGPRRPLFFFLLLVVWIVGSAIVLPRLFAGATEVFSLARSDTDSGTALLQPTSGNISQSVYAIGGFLAACATSAYARKAGGLRAALTAVLFATTLDLGFALLDVVTGATHTSFLLDPIHTASYTLLTTDELGGLKRIAGSFTEASSFATFSLTLLGFNFALYVAGVRPRFTGPASALLTGFIVLSTSSAGYVGLGVFYALFLVYALAKALIWRRRRPIVIAACGIGAAVLLVCIVILFVPTLAEVAKSVVNESLLSKGTSDSAIERGSWNSTAWKVFQNTYCLGGGIGSTRGSNYVLVLLSNLGAIGFVLFVGLVLRVTLARLSSALSGEERAIVWAARIGMLTALVPGVLVGTVYDLGTLFYGLVGIAASGAALGRVPASSKIGGAATVRRPTATFPSGAPSKVGALVRTDARRIPT
jgi:hypothetical protein